jgi:hypothetical protein
MLLKFFFAACIIVFFLLVWFAAIKPGPLDHLSDEEWRHIEREASGCEDEENWTE